MLAPLDALIEVPDALLETVRDGNPIRTAVVNAVSAVALQSAREAAEAGIIVPVLVGDTDEMRNAATGIGWEIGSYELIPASGEEAAAMAGAHAAGTGRVEAIMKGHLHTDHFMRAILNREAGLRLGKPLTHHFYMTVAGRDGALILSDAALNPAPDFDTKKAIIENCIALAKATGVVRPKVALLSASEVPSKHIPSSEEAVVLSDWAKSAVPDADVDGPLAFDLCVSPEAVRVKGVTSPVAGAADIVVVPEIVAGNALYKAIVAYGGACGAGIVLGAKVPILLTSRGDPPAARMASAALAALMGRVGA